jgi:hypothetical protein
MTHDWQSLTSLVGNSRIQIERVRLIDRDITVEGRFDLPPLARLSGEDQIFVAAFVRCHGSIKQMEKFFGVSYPTIKNRLNRIGESMPYVEIDPNATDRPSSSDLLGQLERGELDVAQVLAQIKGEPDQEKS